MNPKVKRYIDALTKNPEFVAILALRQSGQIIKELGTHYSVTAQQLAQAKRDLENSLLEEEEIEVIFD